MDNQIKTQNEMEILKKINKAKTMLFDPSYKPHTQEASSIVDEIIENYEITPNIKSEISKFYSYYRELKPIFHRKYIKEAQKEAKSIHNIYVGELPSLERAKEFVTDKTRLDFIIEREALKAKLEINKHTLSVLTPLHNLLSQEENYNALEYSQNRLSHSLEWTPSLLHRYSYLTQSQQGGYE